MITDETRKKLSDIARQRWASPEFKETVRKKIKKSFANEEVKKKLSDISKKRWSSQEYRDKQTKSLKKRWSNQERRKDQGKVFKKLWIIPAFRQKMIKTISRTHTGRKHSISTKRKIAAKKKEQMDFLWHDPSNIEWQKRQRYLLRNAPKGKRGHKQTEETRKKISEFGKGKLHTIEHNKKVSEGLTRYYLNPANKQNLFKRLSIKPNLPERKIIDLLKTILPNEYKYVGDGQFILGGLCPDFVNCNGQKKIIEVFGRVFHDPLVSFRKRVPIYQTEAGRYAVFAQFGYETLTIWDDELNDMKSIKDKILSFNEVKANAVP